MTTFSGSCLCGQVRYSVTGTPIFMGVCHCADCQKATGSAFSPVVAVPDVGVEMTGAPKTYTKKGDSGKDITRSFCPECGSTLMSRAQAMTGVVMLTTGPMDDASAFTPAMEIYCASAQPWVSLGGDMGHFAGMPTPPA